MSAMARRLLMAAALLLAVATVFGAFGAHALRGVLTPERMDTWQTAVHYQFFHALGLFGLGLLADRRPQRLLHVAGGLLLGGILVFSGSLYLIVAGAPTWLGAVTPVGGLLMIVAWILAAAGLRRM